MQKISIESSKRNLGKKCQEDLQKGILMSYKKKLHEEIPRVITGGISAEGNSKKDYYLANTSRTYL